MAKLINLSGMDTRDRLVSLPQVFVSLRNSARDLQRNSTHRLGRWGPPQCWCRSTSGSGALLDAAHSIGSPKLSASRLGENPFFKYRSPMESSSNERRAAQEIAAAVSLDLAVIGGGASGFFTALQFAEMAPGKRVAIYEKSGHFLQKVRVSGGGRCNVTHACFDPGELAKNYPRGSRELRAAFHKWQPSDTVAWFARFGVTLKTEPDGRMFPTTDNSDTVIQCFLTRARDCQIPLFQKQALIGIERLEGGGFALQFDNLTEPVRA